LGAPSGSPAFVTESETIMVTIRLTRRGARNQPFYHVVVTDSRKRQGGLSLEHVGFFNPIARGNEQKLKLDLPRIDYWVGQGARPSDRVRNLVTSYRKQATA
jgi:small subunit ribosomal protein S16